jgi:preprotein translocase subunit SecG
MQEVILIIHILLAIVMVCLILLQRSEGGALGIGGGGGVGGLISTRGAANLLTRATAVLAGLFFLTSMALTMMSQGSSKSTSVLDVAAPQQTAPGQAPAPAPAGNAGGQNFPDLPLPKSATGSSDSAPSQEAPAQPQVPTGK